MTETRRKPAAGHILSAAAILLVLLGSLLLTGAAAAAVITVEHPADVLTAGDTVSIPVRIDYAEDIAGFQFYVKENSGAAMFIDTGSAAVEGLYLNSITGKAVLYPEDHAPLNGTVRLFNILVTPAAGKNVQISYDIIEVIDSGNNDITSSCVGAPVTLHVADGVTVPPVSSAENPEGGEDDVDWIYDTADDPNRGAYTPEAPAVVPLDSSSQNTVQGASQGTVPVATPRAAPKGKSPGFLPATILGAVGAAAAGIFIRERRRGGV